MRRRVELRGAGLGWTEVGRELGVSVQGAKQYRYLERREAGVAVPVAAVR